MIRRIRFYATSAPSWWPFQVASLGHGRAPPRVPRGDHYHVLLDNGMFTWYKERGTPPDLDAWVDQLAARAALLGARPDVAEVWVVVPDWPGSPGVTIRALQHPRLRRLCRDHTCLVPVQFPEGLLDDVVPRVVRELAFEALVLEGEAILALPMKLYCTRQGRGRRVPSRRCQAMMARLASAALQGTASPFTSMHAFAPTLSPLHIRELHGWGVASFDTNAWTRPNTTTLRRMVAHSAKTNEEKDLFFRAALRALAQAGVPLEAAHLADADTG